MFRALAGMGRWMVSSPRWRELSTVLALAVTLAVLGLFALRVKSELTIASQAGDIRENALIKEMRALAVRFPEARAAGWNAGMTGYAFEGRMTNLDGLVNAPDYLHRYLSQYRTVDYILEENFDLVVDYDKFLGYHRLRDEYWAGMTDESCLLYTSRCV